MVAFFATLLGIAIGFTWWTFASAQADPPIPGGEELETASCEEVVSEDFDFVALSTKPVSYPEEWGGREIITIKFDVQVSGGDFHALVADEGGAQSVELIAVDEVLYKRSDATNQAWQLTADDDPLDYDVWHNWLSTYLGVRDLTLVGTLCPKDVGPVGVVDEVAAAAYVATGVEHFRVYEQAVGAVANVDGSNSFAGYDTVKDYWIYEDTELLVKYKSVYTFLGEPRWTGQTDTDISDIGVPNVITAPI